MPELADRRESGPRPPRTGAAKGVCCVSSHGAVLSVRLSSDRLLDGLRPLLPPGARVVAARAADVTYQWTHAPTDGEAGLHRVTVHDPFDPVGEALVRTHDAREAAERLAGDIEYRVALHARGRLFVHAAAVAWRGRAVLVPGRSFSGKSALTAALLRAGATYLSDEWAVLDERGLVTAHPRPLRLRDQRGIALDAVAPARLGAPIATRPLPVALVVRTTYTRGAEWRPERMHAGETALALLDNAPAARRAPGFALRVIARTLRGALGLRGARGDADDTARAIERALDASHA